MPSSPQACVRKSPASIEEIESFISGLSLSEYQANRRTKLAIERLLQIMTEAAYRLGSKGAELCPEIDWNGVRGLGNFLRHEYDKVSDERIWKILQQRLPMLRVAVQRAILAIENERESL